MKETIDSTQKAPQIFEGEIDQTRADMNRTSGALGEKLRVIAQEQPLLLAALGIALGAAIGAAFPESEREHRWLGPARDRAVNKIKEEGEHAYEQVRGATRRAVEGVKQAVWEVTTGSKT